MCVTLWAQQQRQAACEALLLDSAATRAPLQRTKSHSDEVALRRRAHDDTGSWLRRTLRRLARLLYLCTIISPLLLTLPLSCFEASSELWWSWCVRACEHSGALLIKLAQWSSSRPDLFGDAACGRFAHLQDAATPHAWRDTERTLTREFGEGWRERLRVDASSPILGSGCIAQVYRGQLLGADGVWRDVAVKVLHPYARETIHADMDLLRTLGWALELLPKVKWLNPSGMLDEFSGLLLSQLDLSLEATNLESFRRHFPPETAPVHFPEPMRPYVSEAVLVESFVDGVPFLQWGATAGADARQRVCTEGVDAVIKMIFIDNVPPPPSSPRPVPAPCCLALLTQTAAFDSRSLCMATCTLATSMSPQTKPSPSLMPASPSVTLKPNTSTSSTFSPRSSSMMAVSARHPQSLPMSAAASTTRMHARTHARTHAPSQLLDIA